MSRIMFSYLSKIKVQKLRFSATVSNQAAPPKTMEDVLEFKDDYFHGVEV